MPTVGSVQITWYSGKPGGAASTSKDVRPAAAPSNAPDVSMKNPPHPHSPEHTAAHSPRIQEEEVIASGWGEDGDGEDGMGML